MQSASTINITHSHTEARFRSASAKYIALATLVTVVVLGIGLACAPYSFVFDAADSAAERHLIRFSAAESNEREQYRWSERGAAVRLFGLTRRPLIIDLRMTSPRPPNAAPAEMRLALGSWRSNAFVVEGDWRRYRVLLPPRPGAPDLRLDIRTFRPVKERDTRDLGAAFTRVAVHPVDGLSAPGRAVATLGGIRTVVLLLLPIATFVVMSRLADGVIPWFATAAVAGLVAIGAARPVDAVALLPDLWLIPVGTAVGAATLWGIQSHLSPWLAVLQQALASDTARLAGVLVVASVQGVIFLALVPPWQHYDEPAHFEYAWLLAFHPSWPTIGTVNPAIAWIGGEGRALSHFPTYHLLVSLPLRLTSGLTVIEQLYVARSVSLVMFVVTVAILGGIARTLFHKGHHMRWLMPLTAVLIPPFADIMTAVNNDVGAILGFSLFLWSVVRIIALGWSARRASLVVGAALIAAAMKNVAVAAIFIAPLVLVVAVGLRRQWRWKRLIAALVGAGAVILGSVVAWGDPAGWYRYGAVSIDGAARAVVSDTPHGQQAFRLTSSVSMFDEFSGLATPVASAALPLIAGNPVTVGAWVWASRPVTIAGPGVLYNDGTRPVAMMAPVIEADTKPRFVAWTFEAPEALSSLQVFVPAPPPDADPPVTLFVDGIVAVQGSFSADTPPILDRSATSGFWEGRPFVNLVRNGSAEQAWPYVRPSVDRAVWPVVRRSPSRIVTSVFDIGRTGPIVAFDVAPDLVFRSLASFGWGEVTPPGQIMRLALPLVALATLAGCIRLAVTRYDYSPRYIAIVLFLIIGALLWVNAALRILPALIVQPPPFPRYGFPAIGPLALVLAAGWLAWWSPQRRVIGIATLVISLLMLNVLAYATIWWHWYV
ncbi:MAG: hypothetical protein J7463_00670 [Roseiflexus sp.]|jgi:hypothetical protein|nr:hypothetical protein [Roseiflexus sp.]MBO9333308.1 hypothetical protein [Roseiflexus sp.]MBO9341732.1 hypothetical protein [Roseiflexus sp.]MBO9365569.1 hypothetical protein [Roseiflexus sp.]MBO9381637.1 hypothetical protein [Roseiflexus sp.]